jgi:hypothetical protein
MEPTYLGQSWLRRFDSKSGSQEQGNSQPTPLSNNIGLALITKWIFLSVVTQKRQHSEKEGESDTSHEHKAQEPDQETPR